jgi:hypothetical protein
MTFARQTKACAVVTTTQGDGEVSQTMISAAGRQRPVADFHLRRRFAKRLLS